MSVDESESEKRSLKSDSFFLRLSIEGNFISKVPVVMEIRLGR